jgi:hypothetical protein
MTQPEHSSMATGPHRESAARTQLSSLTAKQLRELISVAQQELEKKQREEKETILKYLDTLL